MKTREQHLINMRAVVTALVEDALAAGVHLRIYSEGEFDGVAESVEGAAALLMYSDDNEVVFINPTTKKQVGWVQLCYVNDDHEVITDHTESIFVRGIVARAEQLAETFEGEIA